MVNAFVVAVLLACFTCQHVTAFMLNAALRRSSSMRLEAARDVTVIGKGAMIDILAKKIGQDANSPLYSFNEAQCKKTVEEVMESFTELIRDDVLGKGSEVRVLQLGTFKKKVSKPRMGRNPKSGESMQIAGSDSVGFTVSSALKIKHEKAE